MSYELFIAVFESDEEIAGEVLKKLRQLKKDRALYFENAAVIVKPQDGDLQVTDVGDIDPKRGKVFGAITGGLVGLLGGPVGAIVGAVAGAATGSTAARLIDYGISNEMIRETEEMLKPGGSAIIAYVQLDWADKAAAALKNAGAMVIRETLEFEGMEGVQHANLA